MLNKGDLYIHADDYGLTNGITQSLDNLLEIGHINSISVIINGYDKHNTDLPKNIRVCAHINIFENTPIFDKDSLYSILDDKGRFKQSFVFYLFVYYFNFRSKRKIIEQIRLEVEAQLIELARAANGFSNIKCIDSHNHIHMIPYIFDIFSDLCCKYKIKSIRTVHEVYYLNFNKDNIFKVVFYIGLIKSLLLSFFTFINRKTINKKKLLTNKYFIGVLFSGRMSVESIIKPLDKIKNKISDNEYVEVVLHPGIVSTNEYMYWYDSASLARFYTSSGRKNENDILRSGFVVLKKQ